MYPTERTHCRFVGPIYYDDDFDGVIGLGEGAFHCSADKLRPVSRGDYNTYRLSEFTVFYGRCPFLRRSVHVDPLA